MKKTIIHSSVFLLASLLTACNNNDTGSKVTSQKEENSSETKSVEYAEIGSGAVEHERKCDEAHRTNRRFL